MNIVKISLVQVIWKGQTMSISKSEMGWGIT